MANDDKQVVKCAGCGAEMPATARFCPSCGLAVNGDAASDKAWENLDKSVAVHEEIDKAVQMANTFEDELAGSLGMFGGPLGFGGLGCASLVPMVATFLFIKIHPWLLLPLLGTIICGIMGHSDISAAKKAIKAHDLKKASELAKSGKNKITVAGILSGILLVSELLYIKSFLDGIR